MKVGEFVDMVQAVNMRGLKDPWYFCHIIDEESGEFIAMEPSHRLSEDLRECDIRYVMLESKDWYSGVCFFVAPQEYKIGAKNDERKPDDYAVGHFINLLLGTEIEILIKETATGNTLFTGKTYYGKIEALQNRCIDDILMRVEDESFTINVSNRISTRKITKMEIRNPRVLAAEFEENKRIAKRILKDNDMNLTLEEIAKCTQLSLETVRELAEEVKQEAGQE